MNINSLTAAKIREIRKRLGLTAEAVASDLGITKSSYSRLENGLTDLTLLKVEALSNIFSVPMTELIPTQGSNSQVANGNGDNINASPYSQFTKNFFPGKDDINTHIIETLTQLIDDMKKEQERQS